LVMIAPDAGSLGCLTGTTVAFTAGFFSSFLGPLTFLVLLLTILASFSVSGNATSFTSVPLNLLSEAMIPVIALAKIAPRAAADIQMFNVTVGRCESWWSSYGMVKD